MLTANEERGGRKHGDQHNKTLPRLGNGGLFSEKPGLFFNLKLLAVQRGSVLKRSGPRGGRTHLGMFTSSACKNSSNGGAACGAKRQLNPHPVRGSRSAGVTLGRGRQVSRATEPGSGVMYFDQVKNKNNNNNNNNNREKSSDRQDCLWQSSAAARASLPPTTMRCVIWF